jgi:hypothetical protein
MVQQPRRQPSSRHLAKENSWVICETVCSARHSSVILVNCPHL